MSGQELISLYRTGWIVCLVLCVVFLAVSVFLFIRFRIFKILSNRTGREMRKSMKAIEQKNARTSALTGAGASRKLKSGHTAASSKLRGGQAPASRVTPPPSQEGQRTYQTDTAAGAASGGLQQNAPATDVLRDETLTDGLRSDRTQETAPATDLLREKGTDILQAPATDVLESTFGATGVLNGKAPGSSRPRQPEQSGRGHDTAAEVRRRDDLPLNFTITKRILILHTNEGLEA